MSNKKISQNEKLITKPSRFSSHSKHLSVMKQAGIVTDDKRGKQVYYRLKVPCVLNFMSCVEAVLKDQAKKQLEL